jgi:hypothetical protein
MFVIVGLVSARVVFVPRSIKFDALLLIADSLFQLYGMLRGGATVPLVVDGLRMLNLAGSSGEKERQK